MAISKTKASKGNVGKETKATSSNESQASRIRQLLADKYKTHDVVRDPVNDASLARVPTGVLSIDVILGGGAPVKRILEAYGPESSGKSALASLISGSFQRQGKTLGYVDLEQAWNPEFAKVFGVNYDETVFVQPDHGELALDVANDLIDNGVGVMVYDSVGATMPKSELEGEMSDQNMGASAKMLNKGIKKLISKCNKQNATTIFINQLRMKIGVMFGSPETTTGGNALKYFASIRLDTRNRGPVKEGERKVGMTQAIKTVKQKTAKFQEDVEVEINWDFGYDNLKDLIKLACSEGVMKKGGAWLEHDGFKAQGVDAMVTKLCNNTENVMKLLEDTVTALIASDKLPEHYNVEHTKLLFKDHLDRRNAVLMRKTKSIPVVEVTDEVTDDGSDNEEVVA